MKMNSLVSVVVPIYNMQKYLERCIDYLLNQTYKNLEIILVDDGSTDCSGTICDMYEGSDNRIVVIHKKNGGVSSARNAGMNVATGIYIMFIDPDDYIVNNAISEMVNYIEKYDVDLVESSYAKFEIDNDFTIIQKEKCGRISSIEGIGAFLKWNGLITSFCWGKLYKTKIAKQISFNTDLRVGEDAVFVYEYLKRSNDIYIINDALYRYFLRNDSAIGNKYTKKRIDAIKSAEIIRFSCNEFFPSLSEEADVHLGLAVFYTCSSLVNTVSWKCLGEYKSDFDYIKIVFRKIKGKTISRNCSFFTMVLWSMCKINPYLYKFTSCFRKRRR